MAQPDQSSLARVRPLRMRLLLLAASGLAPLLMLLAWGINHLIDERRNEAENTVLELSRALATAVDAELRSVVNILEHIGTSDELEQADLRSFQMSAERTAQQLGWLFIVLSDADGRALMRTHERIAATEPNSIEPESLARAIATKAPVVSRVIQAPGQPSTSFAVRVPVVRSGKVTYVLSAHLPTEFISAVLTRQDLPVGSVASIFDQTHRRVVRSRPSSSTAPSASLQALIERAGVQGVGIAVTQEGLETYTGYTRLAGSAWLVVVGTSVEESNKGLHALLRAVVLGVVASFALAMLIAWVLTRRILEPIDALKEGAAALGRGDPLHLPPLDIVELDDVAVALKNAAADRDSAATRVAHALHEAEEANRSKDQFLAVLGHELRNPLAPITTAVRLMALKGDDKTAKERRIIERQLDHVTRLVDDLLDVSRITSGRLEIRREPVRLAQVLTQVVEAIRPLLHQRTLSLVLDPAMDEVWISGDEVRLAQVFNNLLANAIKFTPTGGSIRVRAGASGSQARVEIEDTGVGLSRVELDRIFDVFYQAPQSSDRARGGLGLGLTIVRSLVTMHGGTVAAASAGPGQGTCITVRLPVTQPPAPADDAPRACATRGSGNVLVVDDNEDAANTCATLLRMSGYTVRTAYSPQGALEALRQFTPQAAILDIGLPGMSGYDLAGAMRAPPFHYRGRLVALTGYGQASDMAASRQAGFDAHLTKPADLANLLALLEKFSQPKTPPSAHGDGPPAELRAHQRQR
ncbi:MAG: ATP-binding protein [Ramlibacter sp.]|nr:ATP-binding protein [Ramlibacter sp.]